MSPWIKRSLLALAVTALVPAANAQKPQLSPISQERSKEMAKECAVTLAALLNDEAFPAHTAELGWNKELLDELIRLFGDPNVPEAEIVPSFVAFAKKASPSFFDKKPEEPFGPRMFGVMGIDMVIPKTVLPNLGVECVARTYGQGWFVRELQFRRKGEGATGKLAIGVPINPLP